MTELQDHCCDKKAVDLAKKKWVKNYFVAAKGWFHR